MQFEAGAPLMLAEVAEVMKCDANVAVPEGLGFQFSFRFFARAVRIWLK
ncbi:MAG: hypothetical protein HYU78_11110 [Rhodocyclales bacterium]|nr:hypothetical protein [Rhodocyclales bacterium]